MLASKSSPPAPFLSAEAAWFWTARALNGAGTASPGASAWRAEDVVKCLDTLYRQRRIELLHARILRIWGRRGVAPSPARVRERSDWQIWREAIRRLEGPLRARGIVAGLAGSGGALSDLAGVPRQTGLGDLEAAVGALAHQSHSRQP